MGTLVSQKIDIAVNVVQQSVTATANWIFQLALRIASLRGLSSDELAQRKDITEKGLFVWLAEQALEGISLEVVDPSSNEALERFDFEFKYRADPDTTVRNPNMAKLEEFCRSLGALPSGAEYRVVVRTAPGATEVKGWFPYELRPLQVEREEVLSDHGFGVIGTTLIYRGRGG